MTTKNSCIIQSNHNMSTYNFLFEYFVKFSGVCFSSVVLNKSCFQVRLYKGTRSLRKYYVVLYYRPTSTYDVCCILVRNKFCFGFKNFFKMAPQTGSATPEQIETLLNFLDEHRDLARGRLRGSDGSAHAKRLWEELCNNLNSMGGCTKTVQQWQKVWFDRKHLAKKAAADSRRLASATGGGPLTAPQLSQWQLKILSIMGFGFGDRQTGARVPAFMEINEPIPSTSSQTSHPVRIPQPFDDNPEEFLEYVEPSQEDRQLSQPESPAVTAAYVPPPFTQECPTFTPSSRRTRSTRRRSASTDVRSRLYQYEEERAQRETVTNAELAGIRGELAGISATLLQLHNTIKEYVDRN
ncbi:uncharacterized protein LOC124643621 isoform X1 [Helicoverpa zea]|nr:uncharacterized protein LOC124643621 isoform X1 [Helicoverpa zea]